MENDLHFRIINISCFASKSLGSTFQTKVVSKPHLLTKVGPKVSHHTLVWRHAKYKILVRNDFCMLFWSVIDLTLSSTHFSIGFQLPDLLVTTIRFKFGLKIHFGIQIWSKIYRIWSKKVANNWIWIFWIKFCEKVWP